MVTKLCFVQFIISVLILNYVSGHKIDNNVADTESKNIKNVEESDRLMINHTGCKYVILANEETVLFKKDSGNLEHTVMALLSDELPADQKPNFEINFAVQTTSDLHILMFTRQHYTRISQSKADYEVALGTDNNRLSYFFYSALSERYQNVQFHDLKNTSRVLSSDKYETFYIKISNGTLKYGKHCEHGPICSTDNLGLYRPEIVQIGFQSKSEHGAKILYDCPSDFAGCPLGTA